MGCRLIIHSLSALILTGGLALCATALFTTVWQTLSSNSMGNRTVGLYERCVEQSKAMSIVENTRSWVCSYHDFEKKQSETTKDPHIIRGDVESWRVATLVMLASGLLVGLISLILSFSACAGRGLRCLGISWTVGSVVATLLVLSAVSVFAKNAHDQTNRFIMDDQRGRNLEIFLGWSFYVAVAGAVALLISTILAVMTVVKVFTTEETVVQHKYQYHQVQRNSAV